MCKILHIEVERLKYFIKYLICCTLNSQLIFSTANILQQFNNKDYVMLVKASIKIQQKFQKNDYGWGILISTISDVCPLPLPNNLNGNPLAHLHLPSPTRSNQSIRAPLSDWPFLSQNLCTTFQFSNEFLGSPNVIRL